VVALVAGLLWYFCKKRIRRSGLPNAAKQRHRTEPAQVVDNEALTPWHDVGVTQFSPWIWPPGGPGGHVQPIVEPNEPHRPISIAPQVCKLTIRQI
jgi:hypothetical protein